MQQSDVIIIGAGVIGLAVARACALEGRSVTILEAEADFGTQTSAKGSHVIHSGIYYAPNSLKAKFCVAGRELLYAYCDRTKVRYKKTGKLIVATSEEEIKTLKDLHARALQNGVTDIAWLTKDEAHALEPEVHCVSALWSPSTGIIDGRGLLVSMLSDIKKLGGQLLLNSPVVSGKITPDGISLITPNAEFTGTVVVNAAGLKAQNVARAIEGMPEHHIPPSYFAKGHYYRLTTPSPFTHLVYPVPIPGGLGVHATLNLKGEVKFGPDVAWINDIDYSFDASRERSFYTAIRRYYPSLPDNSLIQGNTGIRPKTVPAGSPEQDFIIQNEKQHGVKGLINLFGIESPGFTSALAIGEEVATMI